MAGSILNAVLLAQMFRKTKSRFSNATSNNGKVAIRRLGYRTSKPHREILTPARIREQKENDFLDQTERVIGTSIKGIVNDITNIL